MSFPDFHIDTGDLIYLDHAATTPVDPVVVSAMLPWFSQGFGNPSSIYQAGQEARAAVDRARVSIARVLNCSPSEILFTSGATESDNLALAGVAWHQRLSRNSDPPPHLITTAIEHHAVLHPAERLVEQGFDVTIVPVSSDGVVDPAGIANAIRDDTVLISTMYANNETGLIQPVQEVGQIAHDRGVLFHCDAVQAAGALPLDVQAINADLLSLSAHKFYGPKGVGILFVRTGVPIDWQQLGGGQEGGRRGGTENVAGIVGMAVALERAEAMRALANAHAAMLRDQLLTGILEEIDGVTLNGSFESDQRLPSNLNLAVANVQGETALLSLDMFGIAASAGSACTTGNSEPSHVLRAMGLSDERARTSLRFTVGRSTTPDQIDVTIDALRETVERIRNLAGGR